MDVVCLSVASLCVSCWFLVSLSFSRVWFFLRPVGRASILCNSSSISSLKKVLLGFCLGLPSFTVFFFWVFLGFARFCRFLASMNVAIAKSN